MGTAHYINPKFFTGLFIPDWLLDLNLSLGAIFCYAKLARLAQKKGYAFPRIENIAKLLKVSDRQVRSYLKELKSVNLLIIKRTGRASNYHLMWHVVMDEPSGSEVPVSTEDALLSDRKQTSAPLIERRESENLKKETPPKKEKSPDYPQEFLVWYKAEYETLLKQPLVVRWGRDKKLMKTILTAYPIEKAKVIARRLLNTTDKWLLGTGRDIPVLARQWQKLVMEGTKPYIPGIDGPSLPSAANLLVKEGEK